MANAVLAKPRQKLWLNFSVLMLDYLFKIAIAKLAEGIALQQNTIAIAPEIFKPI